MDFARRPVVTNPAHVVIATSYLKQNLSLAFTIPESPRKITAVEMQIGDLSETN